MRRAVTPLPPGGVPVHGNTQFHRLDAALSKVSRHARSVLQTGFVCVRAPGKHVAEAKLGVPVVFNGVALNP